MSHNLLDIFNVNEDRIKQLVYGSSLLLSDFLKIDLSEDDQINYIYYVNEKRDPTQLKKINLYFAFLALHPQISNKSIEFLMSLKQSFINLKLYQNSSIIDQKIRKALFDKNVNVRIYCLKNSDDIDYLKQFLYDKSVKVRMAFMKKPLIANNLEFLNILALDKHPKISSHFKEILTCDKDIRQLLFEPIQNNFEIDPFIVSK